MTDRVRTTFVVGSVSPDENPARVIVRAAARDGRVLTVTGLLSDRWLVGDTITVDRVRPDDFNDH